MIHRLSHVFLLLVLSALAFGQFTDKDAKHKQAIFDKAVKAAKLTPTQIKLVAAIDKKFTSEVQKVRDDLIKKNKGKPVPVNQRKAAQDKITKLNAQAQAELKKALGTAKYKAFTDAVIVAYKQEFPSLQKPKSKGKGKPGSN